MSSSYDWGDIPLCRAYRFAEVMPVTVSVGRGGSVTEDGVLVAIGFTVDDQYEALGAWHGPDAWSKALNDLRRRGTEVLRFIHHEGLCAGDETLSALYGKATVVTTGLGKGKKAADDSLIENARGRLSRAIRRRGTFADVESAASFVAWELRRIEVSTYVTSSVMRRSRRGASMAGHWAR